MATPSPALRKESLQTEIDAAFLYDRIAAHETDAQVAKLFREMAGIERGHADHAFNDLKQSGVLGTMPGPSWRARTLDRIGGMMGYDHVIAQLMDVEKGLAKATVVHKRRNGEPITGSELNHVRILQSLAGNKGGMGGEQLGRIEGKHKSVGGNALRAAVLGANDGLVSNMSLVMGVAGATSGDQGVLLAGLAGLLAGAGLQLRAMGEGTAALPGDRLAWGDGSRSSEAWPRATAEAMAAGVLRGLAAAIEAAHGEACRLVPGCRLVLTGGDGPALLPLLHRPALASGPIEHWPDLGLEALAQLRPLPQAQARARSARI